MAQLTGNAIQSSYLGLLKTDDNAAMQNAGFPQITDGAGNNSMLKMSQTELQLGSNINTQYFKQYANSGGITEIKDAAFSIYDATSSQYVIVDATNAGVGSGSNYFLATAAGSSIGGPLDLSGATVTGLPSSGGIVYFGTGKVVNTSYIASDIVQSVVTIPANTFAAGDYFMIRSFEERDSLNAPQYTSMWITPDIQTPGQAPANPSGTAYSFSQIQTSQNGTGSMKRSCFVSAANETSWLNNSASSNDEDQGYYGGTPVNNNNIDWTVNQYIYLQLWSDSTTGTYTNYGMHLTKLN